MTSQRELYEIEVGLAETDIYNYLKNTVIFNFNGLSSILPLFHECDVLVMSKSGYLTEIEIKRSWEDFLADFKKKHKHDRCGVIKNFYYCVSELFADKAVTYLEENNINCDGVYVYNEIGDICFKFISIKKTAPSNDGEIKKLFIEQQLYIAKLGCMRVINLKRKLIKNKDFKTIKYVR